MSAIKSVVLDFDGTLTDAEEEGRPFFDAYLRDITLFTMLNSMTLAEVERRAEEIIQGLDPANDVWLYNGLAAAPTTVDPYLRVRPIAHKILRGQCMIAASDDVLDVILQLLFAKNYPLGGDCPRDGAVDFLLVLQSTGMDCHIVANADPRHVSGKLDRLLASHPDCLRWCKDNLRGNAGKYAITTTFAAVPEKLEVPNLARGVLLRRQKYYELLRQIKEAQELEWSNFLVVGDVFELDLALPLHLGCKVVLIANEYTPPYEIAFLHARANAHVCRNLDEVAALLRG